MRLACFCITNSFNSILFVTDLARVVLLFLHKYLKLYLNIKICIIGVDWKSLTIPACLPITTDFFPDKRSLNNDYVLSIYTLIPDAVNADFMRLRAVQRKPLSTEEVFKELVSQRLAQVKFNDNYSRISELIIFNF